MKISPLCLTFAANSLELAKWRLAECGENIGWLEVRLDYLPLDELSSTLAFIRRHAAQTPGKNFILTLRPSQQGGAREISLTERINIWRSFLPLAENIFCDWEADLFATELAALIDTRNGFAASRLICSTHNFTGVPENLNALYDKLADTPARYLKIAYAAQDATDCAPALRLLREKNGADKKLLCLTMGEAGVATRILNPAFGAPFTFAVADSSETTAPGQLSSRELSEIYCVQNLSSRSAIAGIIGQPVSHSFSPLIHNQWLRETNTDGVFMRFPTTDAARFIRNLAHPRTREVHWNLKGLSVTAPHKTAVIKHLDWIEPAAQAIGAVNTIVCADDKLRGYNTDHIGFIAGLKSAGDLKGKSCAVIGAGGAARCAVWALQNVGAGVTIFARDEVKGSTLAENFSCSFQPLKDADFSAHYLVVNATPLGTRGALQAETPAVARQLSGAGWAYELVYNPSQTTFLSESQAAGRQVIGGLTMLVEQARAQFRLWFGEPPETLPDALKFG